MAASLGHEDAQDRAAAAWTVPARAAKDVECVGVSPRSVARQVKVALALAQGRAQVLKPFVQDMLNRPMQVPCLMNGERTAGALRVNPGLPKGFIDVYIAQAGEKMLVQQQRFDLAIRRLQHPRKPFDREGFVQRFGAQSVQNLLRRCGQPNSTELAGVLEAQGVCFAKVQDHMLMFVAWLVPGLPVQPSGHAQVDHQGQATGQIKQDIFAAAGDLPDRSTVDCPAEIRRVRFGDGFGPVHRCTGNAATGDDLAAQGIDDALDFG